jgi:hypothetical protein
VVSLLSLKDFIAFNSFVVKLGTNNLDFSNIIQISHLNSMPKGSGNLKAMNSMAHTLLQLDCGSINAEFKNCLLSFSKSILSKI